jgi:hypothetical protein
MGLLVPIDADPPFADVDELAALFEEFDARVWVDVATERRDVVRDLLAVADVDASLNFRCACTRARKQALAEYARTRVAVYVDAHQTGGCLRVWRDRVWIDGLAQHPGFAEVRERDDPFGPGSLFDLRCDDLERMLQTWLDLPDAGELLVHVTGVGLDRLECLFAAAGEASLELSVCVATAHALAAARALPGHPMVWSAGDLQADLPECTARLLLLAPISAEARADVIARFDRHRRTT